MIKRLRGEIIYALECDPRRISMSEAETISDRRAEAPFWVTKYIDWSHSFGLGYEICDGGLGFMFNDKTHATILPGQVSLYYSREGRTMYYETVDQFNASHWIKGKVIYDLIKVIGSLGPVQPRWRFPIINIPYLSQWFATSSSIVFGFTNHTVQVNVFNGKSIIMCPLKAAVTCIYEDGRNQTHRLHTIQNSGCTDELKELLFHAQAQIALMKDICFPRPLLCYWFPPVFR